TAQTVDLSALDNAGTDDQNLTLTGNTLAIEDGNDVDLSGYLDNTDDQNIENLGLVGTTLTVGIEDGTAQTVDLASIDTDTDEQDLTGATLTGNTLQIDIENGASTTVDLSALNDSGTDNQNLTGATLNGSNILQIDIEDGSSTTVDLSVLNNSGTDNQTLTAGAAPGSLSISGGNAVTLNVNDADANPNNEIQTLSRTGTNVQLSLGGGTVSIADNDNSSSNEYNTNFRVNGTNLQIIDGGGTRSVPLNTISTDDQFDDEVQLRTPIDVDDAEKATVTNETTVQEVIQAIAPITSKAARIFYPPSIAVDASSNGTGRTINLYTQYTAQFATPAVASAGAPAAIPTYAPGDLYYYVTEFDTSVFANVSVDANGVMTYDVIAAPADYNSLINVVFVVK
ncbi:MAG: hypothetical protein WBG48_14500, partial [Pricia sp.]